MAKWSGLYLHGFLSSGNSEKGQWFLSHVQLEKQSQLLEQNEDVNPQPNYSDSNVQWHDFLTLTYPMKDVNESVQVIEKELKKILQNKEVNPFILGSSMGGFYAQYFGQKYKMPYVMINPALNIDELFESHLGVHEDFVTGEKITVDEHYIKELAKYRVNSPDYRIPSLLLIDSDDEVIDVEYCLNHYLPSKLVHKASKRVVYNGGDHRFIHLNEGWQEINQFLHRLMDVNN